MVEAVRRGWVHVVRMMGRACGGSVGAVRGAWEKPVGAAGEVVIVAGQNGEPGRWNGRREYGEECAGCDRSDGRGAGRAG